MILQLPAQVAEAIGGAGSLIARLPELERAVSEAGSRAQATLDGILERVGPVTDDIDDLRATAHRLESRLDALYPHLDELEGLIDPLEQRFVELTAAANRLDGALVHVLDRVPGLSAEDARERAETPQ